MILAGSDQASEFVFTTGGGLRFIAGLIRFGHFAEQATVKCGVG